MMRKKIPSIVAVLALMLVVPAGTAGGSAQERPFHSRFVGVTTDIDFAAPECPPGSAYRIYMEGSGRGTHLGRFTWTGNHCTQFGMNPPATITIADGHLEFVAANGDVLHLRYAVTNSELEFTSETMWCITDDVVIDGGTGRFAGATGDLIERGCFDPNDPYQEYSELVITNVGTITYDASDRAR